MAIASNFPNGFPQGITIRGVPITQSHPGKVFWVSNATTLLSGQKGGSDGNKGTFDAPFGTIDYAIGQCTANRGDIIFVKPGHAETLSAAGAIAADVAGVAIIGLGTGSLRPTLTLDTATTTTINVSAANVSFKNLILTANFADIVSFFTLTTAKFLTLEDCQFKATATNMNSLYVVDTDATTANADGLAIINCRWIEPDTATVGWVKADGTNDNWRFNGNFSNLGVNNNKSLITVATGKVITNLELGANKTIRLNTDTATGALLFGTDGSTNSGIVYDNYSQHADTAAELIVTASSGLSLFQNYSSGVNGNSGYVIATIDT